MESADNAAPPLRRARGRPRSWADTTDQTLIKSLDRAMVVLDHVSQGRGQTLTAISDDLGQSPATVYRILVTLEGRGLVEFEAPEQLWHIGARAFEIGARFLRRTSLVERARPIMRRLMEETGETANLGIERDGSVLFVSQVETHESIRAFFPPGTLSPLHASGIGKALLAHMDGDRRRRHLASAPRQAFTDRTLTDRAAIEAEMALIRSRGYAVDDEERTRGMRCIAAPVFDLNGEVVAGISVSGPTTRVSGPAATALSRPVIVAAAELTVAIGGRGPAPPG